MTHPQWEYKVITIGTQVNSDEVDKLLRSCGEKGWELITMYVYNANTTRVFIFKRELYKSL